MSAKIIDGKAFAARVRSRVRDHVTSLAATGITPGLAVILVGDDPASQVYVRNKHRSTIEVGMRSFEHRLDASTGEGELLALLARLNGDPAVHGILCQLPLPGHLSEDMVIGAIRPEKDVDGFNVLNVGRLSTGQEAMVPCTPLGCLMLLRDLHGSLSGMNAVIVGRSNIVGKPMANLLIAESCTVTVAHSRTRGIAEVCRRADILVSAAGRPGMVTAEWIRDGATVIDVGINRLPAPELGDGRYRIVGDVQFESASRKAGAITPVPGGVGPMTIACLLANTVVACCRAHGKAVPADLAI